MDSDVFKALSDPKRIRIMEMLCEGEMCACRILEEFDFTQPTLSHHMSVLSKCGLVNSRKEGQWTHYSINKDKVRETISFLDGLLKDDGDSDNIDCCRCIYIDNHL